MPIILGAFDGLTNVSMLTDILKSLGMSEKEAKVYLASLHVGISRISEIAKKAQMSRSTAYNLLHSLLRKGIVRSYTKSNIQWFSPIPPNELVDFLEGKKEEIGNKIEMVKAYLPQLKAVCNPKVSLPKVSFFEGVSGIKQVYADILKNGNKKTFAALSLDNVQSEIGDWTKNVFTPKKVKKDIYSQVLVSSKDSKSYIKLDKKHLRKSLVISHKKYPFEVEIDVYDENKTAFISFDETELMGVIIESSKIANTLKSLFALVWDKTK